MNSTIDSLTTTEAIIVTALAAISHKSHSHKDTSPVTLSPEWSRMTRLLVLSCLSVIGSVGNVFMISSVMIEDHLKKAGNAFIVNVALADLLVTSILIPASIVVLLAGIEEPLAVCKIQWFFAVCAFIVSVITLAITSIENYDRLFKLSQNCNPWFRQTRVTVIIIIIWIIGCTFSGVQFIYPISFDYCTKRPDQKLPFQAVVIAGIILIPVLFTFYKYMILLNDVKHFKNSPNFKPKINYTWDLSLTKTNFYSFLIFIAFWLPFGIVLAYGTVEIVPSRIFYNTAWIGLSKSCFHNVIYCITNRHFRNAYVSLFHYCCCKTTVSTARRTRVDGCRPTSDVRVHIIPGYNMYSYTSPQRTHHHGNSHHGYWSKRDVHEL